MWLDSQYKCILDSAWDISASWCQASIRYSPLHLGKLRLNQSKCFEEFFSLTPDVLRLSGTEPGVKGIPSWEEIKSLFTLVQSNTYCRLHVFWLIWFVVSDVTVLFWPITSWWTNDSEEQWLDLSRTTRGASSSIHVRAMHKRGRAISHRHTSFTPEQRKCELCISKVIVNLKWSNMAVIGIKVVWPKRSRDIAVVVQVSYFECNFEKIYKKNGTWLTKSAAVFSSDRELTNQWKREQISVCDT